MTNQRSPIGCLQTRDEFIRHRLQHTMLRQKGRKRLRKKKAKADIMAQRAYELREARQNVRFASQDLHGIIACEVDMMIAYYAMRGQTNSMCFFDSAP